MSHSGKPDVRPCRAIFELLFLSPLARYPVPARRVVSGHLAEHRCITSSVVSLTAPCRKVQLGQMVHEIAEKVDHQPIPGQRGDILMNGEPE